MAGGSTGYPPAMTTAPFEPGSDPSITGPDAPDPVAPGEQPGGDPGTPPEPRPTES